MTTIPQPHQHTHGQTDRQLALAIPRSATLRGIGTSGPVGSVGPPGPGGDPGSRDLKDSRTHRTSICTTGAGESTGNKGQAGIGGELEGTDRQRPTPTGQTEPSIVDTPVLLDQRVILGHRKMLDR